MKNKILKMVSSLLYAQRNNDLKKSDKIYHKLLCFCQSNNINFENAIEGATKELRKKPSFIMQGI